MKSIAILILLSAFSLNARAQLKSVKINNKTTFEVSNWMDDGGVLPKAGLARQLALAKKSFFENNKKVCLSQLTAAYGAAKSIRQWVTLLEFKCALLEKPASQDLERLTDRVRKSPQWLVSNAYAIALRPLFVESLVRLAEKYAKNNRARAWQTINEALAYSGWLNNDQKADLYRYAGEISFVEQNLLSAKDYLQKSLEAKDSPELRKRVESLQLALRSSEKSVTPIPPPDMTQEKSAKKEQDLFARMTSAVQSKDFISAIDDGVNLLVEFPNGARAEDVDNQISGLYLGLATSPPATWDPLKKRVLSTLKKVGGDRLYTWARLSYNRGLYQEAFELADKAADKLEGEVVEGDALFLAGRSAHASKEPNLAIKAFQKVIDKFSGSAHVYESLFRLGLIHFKKNDFDESAAVFERLISLKGAENFEYRGLYWAWRSLQRLKLERAQEMSKRLIERYPMTLYGMKALAESAQNKILLKVVKSSKIEITLRLMPDQFAAWERVPLLLRSGWFEEAQAELDQLPTPQSAEDYLLRALLYSQAQAFTAAITQLNRAIELNPEFAYQKEYLLWVFPQRFKNEIAKWSSNRGLTPIWVRSLIRQESAFQPRAVSRSNALGLMQLIPPTASEVAQELKKSNVQLPQDLFVPMLNVEFGSHYLKKMMNQFGGQLPFALAAYNAGPTRLARWLESSGTEMVESEVWMDELPWSETSFYVKSILRNILIFELLDKGQIQLSSPIWQISSKSS